MLLFPIRRGGGGSYPGVTGRALQRRAGWQITNALTESRLGFILLTQVRCQSSLYSVLNFNPFHATHEIYRLKYEKGLQKRVTLYLNSVKVDILTAVKMLYFF